MPGRERRDNEGLREKGRGVEDRAIGGDAFFSLSFFFSLSEGFVFVSALLHG